MSEMADGFDEYRPPLTSVLAGRRIELSCVLVGEENSEHVFAHEFGADELTWTVASAQGVQSGQCEYEAFEMRPGLFFVHYRRAEADHPVVVTFALDLTAGQATGAVGELGLGPEPHLAVQTWFQGQVAGSGATRAGAHPHTEELIGRRVRYAYSGDDVYDHVYLNRHLFTWFCVSGAEAGLGDTDRCTHWKLRDQTYLFSWLEKNLGVEGMVVVDLEALRTVGIQFGLDQRTGDLVNITMGAYALPLGFAPGVEDAMPGPSARQ
ncbi:MoaF C-terminal domain-containing protein [Amycolatopsis thermoflava]|uniref:MoaF C-terminal domain-containing protein n=1 Tax=Amycolatopsis thermoflava TaxID=84480 RepID=UPI0036596B56